MLDAGCWMQHWPISQGRDLSRGATYEDASSIFAYECDQDFFGSYDDDADYGVVACANHHVLPGKKAWTWGHGSYGTMHQTFELLVLMQTGKMGKIPVILFGKNFWKPLTEFINKTMYKKYNALDVCDTQLYQIVDSVDEAMKIIKTVPKRK